MKAIKLLILVITFLLIADVELNATAMFDVTFKITVLTKLAYSLGEETPGGSTHKEQLLYADPRQEVTLMIIVAQSRCYGRNRRTIWMLTVKPIRF
ncbi:MAG: hypothetical protein WCI51_16280 [Lentisphaerota bacterium]